MHATHLVPGSRFPHVRLRPGSVCRGTTLSQIPDVHTFLSAAGLHDGCRRRGVRERIRSCDGFTTGVSFKLNVFVLIRFIPADQEVGTVKHARWDNFSYSICFCIVTINSVIFQIITSTIHNSCFTFPLQNI